MSIRHWVWLGLLLLPACSPPPPQALGTLEWERISIPAPVSEPIVEILVKEGQQLAAGQMLLRLDPARAQARLAAARAEVERAEGLLAELDAGARSENRNEARARLQGANSRQRNSQKEFERVTTLVQRGLLGNADLDRARAARDSGAAEVAAATAALAALENGTRNEQLVQAQAALALTRANAELAQIELDRLSPLAPRTARVEALPYEQGDQPVAGAPVVVLLVGDRPYARVYVPASMRTAIAPGTAVRVVFDSSVGADLAPLHGTVRTVQSEASFTPYYALSGTDATRLSYLAEVELGPEAANLPAGLPLRIELPAAKP